MIVHLKKALPINSARWGSPVVQQVKNLKLIAMVVHFAWSQLFRPAASGPQIFGALTAAREVILNYSRFCIFAKSFWWSGHFLWVHGVISASSLQPVFLSLEDSSARMATPIVRILWADSVPYIFVTPHEKKMELGQYLLKISLNYRSTLRGQFFVFAGRFALVYHLLTL